MTKTVPECQSSGCQIAISSGCSLRGYNLQVIYRGGYAKRRKCSQEGEEKRVAHLLPSSPTSLATSLVSLTLASRFYFYFFLRTADDSCFSILFYLAYFQPSPDKGAAWRPAFKPRHWLRAPPVHSPSKTFSLLHFTGGSGPFIRELLLGVVDLIHSGNSIQTASCKLPPLP